MMREWGYTMGGDYGGDEGGISCQDCGNKAKKDCQHMRCRTCCRNRGFPCETHVKSTWVPAAKRRERQQQRHNSSNQQLSLTISSGGGDGDGGGGVGDPIINHHNTSSELGLHFPAEMSSPTLFRRVRVSGMDETNEQYAYQTAISVGGHVFNGVLYDHGPDQGQYNHAFGESSTATGNQHQDVKLITSGTSSSSSYQAVTIVDPSSIYPTPLCAFFDGTQVFPPPRS